MQVQITTSGGILLSLKWGSAPLSFSLSPIHLPSLKIEESILNNIFFSLAEYLDTVKQSCGASLYYAMVRSLVTHQQTNCITSRSLTSSFDVSHQSNTLSQISLLTQTVLTGHNWDYPTDKETNALCYNISTAVKYIRECSRRKKRMIKMQQQRDDFVICTWKSKDFNECTQ